MSTIKVNTITTRSGSTITLGESGKTISLACGASQSGFGRTGTVDWCTTAKTSPLTAESGKGYFINTTGGAVTVTLPSSPSAGDIVSLKDYANTFCAACKNLTIGRGGSKIAGLCIDATSNTKGDSITLVYVDGTKGWLNIQTDDTVVGNQYIAATGGQTTITCGDYKTHIFTSDGCFQVTSAGQPGGSTVIEYFVVAGGGGGGTSAAPAGGMGGGGAGGFRLSNSPGNAIPAPTMSPLINTTALTASVATFPVTIGGGGAVAPNSSDPFISSSGSNSVFSSITSAGGGRGGGGPGSPNCSTIGAAGGSGGGGQYNGPYPKAGGAGNTPPVSPPQGNPGGAVTGASDPPGSYGGSGGGGAGAAGGGGNVGPGAFPGGAGSYVGDPFFGPTAPSYGTPGPVSSTRYFAGGGGGGNRVPNGPSSPTGSDGGGGTGAKAPHPNTSTTGTAGTANTGGGGGGGNYHTGGAGGSGFVAIRYKFQ
tara:strand:- start:154 stop:1590 length:1437 start_codon:yes stop_codon:yes gene_type:complete